MNSKQSDGKRGCLLSAAIVFGVAGMVLSILAALGFLSLNPYDSDQTADSLLGTALRFVWLVGIVGFALGFVFAVWTWQGVIWPLTSRADRRSVKRVLATSATALWGILIVANVVLLLMAPSILAKKPNPRWNPPPQDGLVFGAGETPSAITFDGTCIWVANNANDTVTKLRCSDGSLVGTYYAGSGPGAVMYDGESIWVRNCLCSCVTKLRAADGRLVGSYNVGGDPLYMAFDGTNVWIMVVNGSATGCVCKLRASDGMLVGTYDAGVERGHIAFDGANIWVTGCGPFSADPDTLVKLRASDGTVLASYPVEGGAGSMCYDGVDLWVANHQGGTVTKLATSDGTVLGIYEVGGEPNGMAFDGTCVWVSNTHPSCTVTRLTVSDGSVVSKYQVGSYPTGIVFDGSHMWTPNFWDETVTRLDATG
jgi:DNA-binding beta-propeller fold protein YncE